MTFMRLPLFTWTVLVALMLILAAFPPLSAALFFLMLDRWFGTHFYTASAGASPLLWQHLFWLFGHPEVYIMILRAWGIVIEVVTVFSHRPLFGYPVVVYSTILSGFCLMAVAENHGPHAQRTSGKGWILADLRRVQLDLLPDALFRRLGDAVPDLSVSGRDGMAWL